MEHVVDIFLFFSNLKCMEMEFTNHIFVLQNHFKLNMVYVLCITLTVLDFQNKSEYTFISVVVYL